jgi:hypothetical protein
VKSRAILLPWVLIAAVTALNGCGSSAKHADITVSPATAMIAVNSSMSLSATGSAIVKYSATNWFVQEDDNTCQNSSVPPQHPSNPCLAGWIWYPVQPPVVPTASVIYYSPSSPGVYHVEADVVTESGTKGQAISTITVTP